jgi:hypothetical protein
MKRYLILLACSGSLLQTALPQSIGTWRSYLAYNNTTSVAEGNNLVYALADSSLYSYSKEDNSLRCYSKENGMNDNKISCIAYHSEEKTLVVIYANGNIDLVEEGQSAYNLPFILNSGNIQDKTVYSVHNYGETAYLSAAFGVVALNVKKKEIKETCRFSTPVHAVAVHRDYIYALTAGSIRRAALKDNLIDPASWIDYTVSVSGGAQDSVLQLCVFRDALCFLISGKGIYSQSGDKIQPLLSHASIRNIKVENEKLIAFSANELYIYSSFTERDKGNIAGITDVSSLKDPAVFWLATGEKGLTGIRRAAAGQYETIAGIPGFNSPARNLNAFMRMHGNKLCIAGGGRWTNRFNRPGTVMIYDTDSLKWNNLESVSGFRDATSVAVDPKDEQHLFVSTWGEGVYEFKDGRMTAHYNHTNSSLSTIYPGSGTQNNYIRVEGVCFDKDHNLWMTNTEVNNVINVLKADGSWAALRFDDIAYPTLADKILIASNGYKWVNLVRAQKSGIFIFDDRGTVDEQSDDISYYYSSLNDYSGNIGATEFFCITEDTKGHIWIGTNRGAFIISSLSRIMEGGMTGTRIIHSDEYGNPHYFLADERVNTIATDGGNRKWIGTNNSGIYLVSEDGSEIISHFTAANSPLLSNTIESIAISQRTGEVFIGTDKGLISYMGDAVKGSENYSAACAYPNPVRPGFARQVIITGLMENSNVKITDAAGNLIFQGRSAGGQIAWNCRNRNGKPVAAGVYIVFSSTPGAGESAVTRIAVVNE